jgi:peptide/nickel transport system substrate-binding protein
LPRRAATNRHFDATIPQRPFDPEKAKFHLKKAGIGSTPLPLYVMAGNTMADQALLLQQSALQAGRCRVGRLSGGDHLLERCANHEVRSGAPFRR